MGGNNSKFRKYVENGDEVSSLKLIEEHSELLTHFNPNENINESNESSLLLCCKWSMTSIVKTLLYECNGNPNQRNVFNQTALHLICQIPVRFDEESIESIDSIRLKSTEEENEKRANCLKVLLDWNQFHESDKCMKNIEVIDINALDRNGNTALHLAVSNGLFECIKILCENDCNLFIENQLGDTVCDVAIKHNCLDILKYLEFKIVFSSQSNVNLNNNYSVYNLKEDYSQLMFDDLEKMKNELIVETSNLLNISLSSAEVILRSYDWSQESLIDNWFNDTEKSIKHKHLNTIYDNDILKTEDIESVEQKLCDICSQELVSNGVVGAKCGHQFCTNCWQTYIELKIDSGDTSCMSCPAFNCCHLITIKIIEKVVSPEYFQRFLQKDIEVFIENNQSIQWCPYPVCNKAVYLPESKTKVNSEHSYILANMPPLLPVSHSVECGSGHNFCWECRKEPHSPCDCKLWEDWMTKIGDIKAEELKQKYSRTEDAANSLWLVRNAKQCPRCKAHIQKSDGCNHLRCYKCKYDFCWICLETWKKHNSGTGGYFRCNRSEAAQRAEQNLCLLKRVAEAHNCEMKELKKFVFYYTKYKFNLMTNESQISLIERSKSKQKELFKYSLELTEINSSSETKMVSEDDDFLYKCSLELIRSRNVLCGSAVYGYYLEDHGYNKAIFEYMENNLNFVSNRLSETISGNFEYLRNSKSFIIDLTDKMKIKRLELLSAVCNGLIPPETPSGFNKHQRRHCLPGVLALDSMENLNNPCDENDISLINQAIISSLSDLNDKNSWIQDKHGRHNNLFVLYDWPDDCHVDYSHLSTCGDKSDNFFTQNNTESDICCNSYCWKPKILNPRTGQKHDFCSLKCKYLTQEMDNNYLSIDMNYKYDNSMDLLIAIEMSKISYEEERQRHEFNDLSTEEQTDNSDTKSDTNNSNPFEMFVEDIKANPDVSQQSSTKTAIKFFLKSSFNDMIDDKNINLSSNDFKTNKQLFSNH
ncbi:ankyrin repeat and IBR domain-containing protein 1-like [Oppia nitens]|uniref:ankyrin repeat and IBR domain-containing protein 1-like n=1 Tax=Oppia nitens TaxID=1686743 RepID=UPI0023DC26B2|nr:ankyrin repeat and IBR domain-containing protein 1-like [Oppia nitens]